jgi:hypothetical protein
VFVELFRSAMQLMQLQSHFNERIVCSDLSLELPFTLTHPKPPESPASSRPPSTVPPTDVPASNQAPVDTNLIQLDAE